MVSGTPKVTECPQDPVEHSYTECAQELIEHVYTECAQDPIGSSYTESTQISIGPSYTESLHLEVANVSSKMAFLERLYGSAPNYDLPYHSNIKQLELVIFCD